MTERPKPTIAELERILEEAPGSIEIQPDGSIITVDGEPQHAKPEIVSLADIVDITPPHEPIGVARDMVKHAVGAKAGLYVLVSADDKVKWNMCGHSRRDILWALEVMKLELMTSGD